MMWIRQEQKKNVENSKRGLQNPIEIIEIMAKKKKKDEVNGQKGGQYRQMLRSKPFAVFHIYVHNCI